MLLLFLLSLRYETLCNMFNARFPEYFLVYLQRLPYIMSLGTNRCGLPRPKKHYVGLRKM